MLPYRQLNTIDAFPIEDAFTIAQEMNMKTLVTGNEHENSSL